MHPRGVGLSDTPGAKASADAPPRPRGADGPDVMRPSVLAATPGGLRSARGRIADAIDAVVATLDDEEGLRKGMTSVVAKLRDPAQRLGDLRKLTPHMIRWHKPDRRLAGAPGGGSES